MPYLLAGYLWTALTNPALISGQDKDTELVEKKEEQARLQTKLNELNRIKQEHANLEQQIGQLRGSVPKSADVDILVRDIEKMALNSGLDVLGFEPPEKEKMQRLGGSAEPEEAKPPGAKLGQALGARGLAPEKPALAGKPASKTASAEAEIGLSKRVLRVKLMGDYPSFIKFMTMLEDYQRVLGINQVELAVPFESGGLKKTVDPSQLQISFLMTAYYLP